MRLLRLALSLSLTGCGASALQTDDADVADDASGAADVALADDAPPAASCSLGGTGRLRVALTLDPALIRRSPEVWLSTRCGDDDREVRLVRWDRSDTMVLDGFGPGAYTVVASSFLAAPARTARVVLGARATASLSVTLPAEPVALATVRAGAGVAGLLDAGLLRDAEAPALDAARPAWSARAIIDEEGYGGVGSVDVDAQQVSDETLELRVLVRNTCAASNTSTCPVLQLGGAEVRSLFGDAPRGTGVGEFERTRLAPGESASLLRAITLRGSLPGEQSALHVAVHGAVVRPAASAMRP